MVVVAIDAAHALCVWFSRDASYIVGKFGEH